MTGETITDEKTRYPTDGGSLRVWQDKAVPTLAYIRLVFVVFGSLIGTSAVAVAEIERQTHFSHGEFGLLLGVAVLGGSVSTALVSVRSHRRGPEATLREALLVYGLILAGFILVPTGWSIAIVFVLAMSCAGAVDVVINTIANEVTDGHPTALLRTHALFNLGAAIGAAITGLFIANDWDWRYSTLVTGVIALAIAITTRATVHEDKGEDLKLTASLRAVVQQKLLLVALAFVLGTMVEGGVETWGPLYLRLDLDSGVIWSAGAAAAGYLIGTSTRLGASFMAKAVSSKWLALLGAFITLCGLCAMVSANSTAVAVIGLAFSVGGISVNWPLMMAYASQNSPNPSLVTGGLSTAGYSGLVIGPALLGNVASAFDLHTSIVTLLVFGVAIVATIAVLPKQRAVHS